MCASLNCQPYVAVDLCKSIIYKLALSLLCQPHASSLHCQSTSAAKYNGPVLHVEIRHKYLKNPAMVNMLERGWLLTCVLQVCRAVFYELV